MSPKDSTAIPREKGHGWRGILGENFSRNSIRGFVVWTLALVALAALWSGIAAWVHNPSEIMKPCKRITIPCVQAASDFEQAWRYVRDAQDLSAPRPEMPTASLVMERVDNASDNLAVLRTQLRKDNAIFIPLYASVYVALTIWSITFLGIGARWLSVAALVALSALVATDIRENLVGNEVLNALGHCVNSYFLTGQPECGIAGGTLLRQFATLGADKWAGYALLTAAVAILLLRASKIHRRRLALASGFSVLGAAAAVLSILLVGQTAKVSAQGIALLSGGATVIAFSFALAIRWVTRVWRYTGWGRGPHGLRAANIGELDDE